MQKQWWIEISDLDSVIAVLNEAHEEGLDKGRQQMAQEAVDLFIDKKGLCRNCRERPEHGHRYDCPVDDLETIAKGEADE